MPRSWIRSRGAVAVAAAVCALCAAAPAASAGATPRLPSANANWRQYVEAPATTDVHPVAVVSTAGQVTNAAALTNPKSGQTTTLTRSASDTGPTDIVLDYGKDVGGIPYLNITQASGSPTLTASYSEGLPYVSPAGDGGASQSASADGSRADHFTVTHTDLLTTGLIQGGERYQELSLTSPGTVSISSGWIHFTAYRATPSDYHGWFVSSSGQLNRIWYDGAYTTQLDQLPANSLPAAWTVNNASLDANGGNIGVLGQGVSWSDYTDSFQAEIISRQAGWVVRASPGGTAGYLFILDADNDPSAGGGPTNTLQELYFSNGSYTQIADVPLGVDLAPGTWHQVQTALSGPTITVSLDGRQLSVINTSNLPSGVPALTTGTVGFREYPGEEARFRDLSVTSPSGTTLYANPLSSASALSDFTGPPVTSPDPLPVIMDGAKRDRVVWSGDLGVEGPNIFYSTAANDYVRGSLQLLASYQNANGESGTNVPPTAPLGTFPESGYTYSASYSMDELDNIATYYRYTDDLAFVKSEWPMIQRELAYNHGMVDSRGLLITNGSNGLDWDYYDGAKTGAVTAYNVIYFQTLEDAAMLADALGSPSQAATYRQQANSLRTAINHYLFDSSTGLYNLSDARPGTFAQDGNALAVLYGVAPTAQRGRILAALQHSLSSTPYGPLPYSANTGYSQSVSPFVTNEEAAALFSTGDTSAALSMLKTVWGHMDSPGPYYTGADWELVGSDGTPGFGGFTSLAHGWASGATADLSAYVLGVQPASPGYQTWTVAPHPGSLAWAKGQVPTPAGPISVHWSRTAGTGTFTMDLRAPRDTSGTVAVPVPAGGSVLVDGTLAWTGTRAAAYKASIQGGYVYLHGITSSHVITTRAAA